MEKKKQILQENALTAQIAFMSLLKIKYPKQIMLADELAELLGIEVDSAYRRLRSQTAITLDDAVKISNHFQVSLDILLANQTSRDLLFRRVRMSGDGQNFQNYLQETFNLFRQFSSLKNFTGIYSAKDIPIFYYFNFPELAKFKMFFWLKTMKEKTDLADKNFAPELISDELFASCVEISKIYSRLPFVEIWNEETVTSMLRQLDYYEHSGFISSRSHGLLLCDQFEQLIRMIEKQCQTGIKHFHDKAIDPPVPYQLYFNEVSNPEEVIAVKADGFDFSLVTYNLMDYLCTNDAGFSGEMMEGLNIQIKKAVPFCGTSEKERNRFFKKIYARIDLLKAKFNQ